MSRTVICLRKTILAKPFLPCQSLTFRQLSTDDGHTTTVVSGRWRRFWRNWVPIPTGVGVTVLAVLQWRRIQRQRRQEQGITPVAKNWQIACYRAVPCRALSRAWGWMSSQHVPGPLRSWVYGLYCSMYGVNLDEMAGDLCDYPSLGQFFTRGLKPGVRPIDPSDCIVSPADGRVLNCGRVCSCKVEQIKGVTYSIQTFLGEPTWKPKLITPYQVQNTKLIQDILNGSVETDENDNKTVPKKYEAYWGGVDLVSHLMSASQDQMKLVDNEDWHSYKAQLLENPDNELYQAVVYLAPGDYHRFHSPIHWKVNFRRHFQGELLSVNPSVAGWMPELFSLNERVVYVGEWEHGFFSMTAVGATNVGSIRVHSDKSLQTNTRRWRDGTGHKDRIMNVNWSKGEEVGEFRMGSTIVLIFEAPRNYKFNIKSRERVQVGQSLCCLPCAEGSKTS